MTTLSDFQRGESLFVANESLAHALKLQQKAELLQDEVRSIMEDAEKEAAPLVAEIEMLLAARDRIVNQHQADKVEREGTFYITVDKKPKEVIDVDVFRKEKPKEFKKLFDLMGFEKFKPSKEDASKVLTTFQVEKLCKKQGKTTYKVDQDLRGIMPEKAAVVEP